MLRRKEGRKQSTCTVGGWAGLWRSEVVDEEVLALLDPDGDVVLTARRFVRESAKVDAGYPGHLAVALGRVRTIQPHRHEGAALFAKGPGQLCPHL